MKPLGFSYMHLSNKKIYLDKNVAAVAAAASSSVCPMNRLIETEKQTETELERNRGSMKCYTKK